MRSVVRHFVVRSLRSASGRCHSQAHRRTISHPNNILERSKNGLRLNQDNFRRCMSGMPYASGADGVIKSPLPDEDLTMFSLSDYAFSRASLFGSKTALVDDVTGKSYSYSQIEELSRRVGSHLTRRGFRKGDVVCYFGTNNPEFAFLILGCASTGVILTTANPVYTTAEIKRQMENSGAKAAFTVPVCVDRLKEAGIKDITVIGEAADCRPFSTVLEDDGRAFPNDVTINPEEDVVVLPYSSGTTGLPKGVMLTHHNVVANLRQLRSALKTTVDDNNFAVLPFFHIYGMMPVLLATLIDGGCLYTTTGFDPVAYLDALTKREITQIHIVPPIVLFMAKHPLVDKYDLSRIRTVISGAAPLGETLTHEFQDRRNLIIRQGYGMTETSPVVAVDIYPTTVGSTGPLVSNTEARILDTATGKPVGANEAGELWVRGPQNMKGYFNNERATREMIDEDGWLHTGDVGCWRENNRLTITDRVKEIIKFKGIQIAPAELEDIIYTHPSVQDVAVVGIADERAGEVPRAFIVCKPDTDVKENDIAEFVNKNVAEYKQLRGGVKIVKEIPKSPSGKILRRVLKEA